MSGPDVGDCVLREEFALATVEHTMGGHGLRPVEEGPGDETHHTFRMLLLVYDVSQNAGSEPIRGCLVAAHALLMAGTRDSDLLANAEGVAVTDEELIGVLEELRGTMIAVATGGPRIADVNERYQQVFAALETELAERDIDNPIRYRDLWDWYGRWSTGDLPSYQSRRTFVSELVNPLIGRIRAGYAEDAQPTGWARVDRTVDELRNRLAASRNEEGFQTVGLLGRETLISLAQEVYTPELHPPTDGVQPGGTDAKRMLEAYLEIELASHANEEARRHAKSALAFANALQHRRTATFRDAALCTEATTAVVNVVAILAGRRDPE